MASLPSRIILLCVRWYLLYPLSYRDLEEIMIERGLPCRSHDNLPLGAALRTRTKEALLPSSQSDKRLDNLLYSTNNRSRQYRYPTL